MTMDAPITLTESELVEITGYKMARFQKRHFDGLGVPNVIRPDGSLSVVRAHLLNYRPPRAVNDEPAKRVKRVR
jgi:hypothetical protein